MHSDKSEYVMLFVNKYCVPTNFLNTSLATVMESLLFGDVSVTET